MNPSIVVPRMSIPVTEDSYAAAFLSEEGIRKQLTENRTAWINDLRVDRKEEILFELDAILKGLNCFANPRNLPGPLKKAPAVVQDYSEALTFAKAGLSRVITLTKYLLATSERALTFQNYLETQLPDDRTRMRMMNDETTQDSPEQSLIVLRQGLGNLFEVATGLARLERLPYRMFKAFLQITQREIAQSVYFSPPEALEFRPSFDTIRNPRVVEVTQSAPGEQTRRLVALTFLSLFRFVRFLDVMERQASEKDFSLGSAYLVLAALRSDVRAFTAHLRNAAGAVLSAGYEKSLFRVPASELAKEYASLRAEGHHLLELKATFEGIGANLRLETRRVYEHELPVPNSGIELEKGRAAILYAVSTLRPAVQNAILFLGKTLGSRLDEHGVFNDVDARRAISSRLRRDVWMFAQIVRAFGEKAKRATPSEVMWTKGSPLGFVREFLSYFRAMGYPLLRATDFPRVRAFMDAASKLEESDLLDVDKIQVAIAEATDFQEFLTALFEQIGLREELRGIPFDRRAAAEALKLYLGVDDAA